MNIKITPYESIDAVVNKALHKAMRNTNAHSVGFVGDIDTIQEISRLVLEDAGRVFDRIDIDISKCEIYQLTIDEDGFISVVPIRNKYGNYLVVDADIRYVSDEIPLSYFSRLDDCGKEYTVFGFDYDDSEYDILDDQSSDGGIMSDEEARHLWENAKFSVLCEQYGRLPEDFRQLVDLARDYNLV